MGDKFWPFTVDAEQINKQLLHQKRSLEVELRNEMSKRQKVQSEAAELCKVTKEQKKTIASLHSIRGKKGRGASSKSWEEYSRQHQRRKRKELGTGIKAVCEGGCFTPVSIEVAYESGVREHIDVSKGTASNPKQEQSEDLHHFALYIKDKFTLSDAAYREVSQLTPSILN